jgi:hypothetical protein
MPDLEIERDDRFIAIEHVLHHVAVVVMVAAVLAGALGVFGFGPLSSSTAARDGFEVTYDRFARNGAPLTLEITTTGTQVWINEALIDAVQVDRVLPAPAQEQRSADGTTFTFDAPAGEPIRMTFALTGDTVGLVRGQVGVSAGDTIAVPVVFYP